MDGIRRDNEIIHWDTPPVFLSMPDNEAHIWRVTMDPPPRTPNAIQALTLEEQARLAAFQNADRAAQFTVLRTALRQILSLYAEVPPIMLRLIHDRMGRPVMAPGQPGDGLHFSIAHSRVIGLIAVTRAGPIGVDVEFMRADRDFSAIAGRFFLSTEARILSAMSGDAQRIAFYRSWTIKEACLKAMGLGLAEGLAAVETNPDPAAPPHTVRVRGENAAVSWELAILQTAREYAAAAALQGPRVYWRGFTWSPDYPLFQAW